MAQSKPKRKKKIKQQNSFNLKKAVAANTDRLRELCKAVGSNISDKLSNNDFIDIYIATVKYGGVKVHPEYNIPPLTLSLFKKAVKMNLYEKRHSTLKPSDIKICLYDLNIMNGLMSYIEKYIKTDKTTYKELLNDIKYLEEYFSTPSSQYMVIDISVCMMTRQLSFPTKTLYTLHYNLDSRPNYMKLSCNSFYHIKSHPPVKEYISINDHWRPVYLLQYPDFDQEKGEPYIQDCEINTCLLNKMYVGKKSKLPVYLQSHAMDRICERLYPLNIIFITEFIEKSLYRDVKICFFQNRLLFEVNSVFGKLGYFVAEIIDEKIIMKTFLLLSNNSTPEGTSFNNLTGFTKYDVDYWDFNSLPTFINNQMNKNNPLYTYFDQAGIIHLFDLTPDIFIETEPDYDNSTEINWGKVDKYLNNTVDKEVLSKEEFNCIHFNEILR